MGDGVSVERLNGEITPGIFESMLEDYSPNVRYLKDAQYDIKDARVGARGTFEIPSSCYCESTGHFNAVELILCFNQLGFILFSEAIERGDVPELGMKTFNDLRKLQLGGAYITRVRDISFKSKIDPTYFTGEIYINQKKTVRGNTFYRTEAHFSDLSGGRASTLMNVAALQ